MSTREGTLNDLVPGLTTEKPDPPPAKIVDMTGEAKEEKTPATKTTKKKAKKKVAKKRAKASKAGNKVCVRCGKEKPAKEFPLVKKDDGPDGRRRSYCTPCWPKYQQEYRQRKENGDVKTTKKKAAKKTKKKAAKKTKKKVAKKAAPKKRKTTKKKKKTKKTKKKVARKITKKKAKRKTTKRVVPKMANGHLGALLDELKTELVGIRKEQAALAKREIAIERRLAKIQKIADAW